MQALNDCTWGDLSAAPMADPTQQLLLDHLAHSLSSPESDGSFPHELVVLILEMVVFKEIQPVSSPGPSWQDPYTTYCSRLFPTCILNDHWNAAARNAYFSINTLSIATRPADTPLLPQPPSLAMPRWSSDIHSLELNVTLRASAREPWWYTSTFTSMCRTNRMSLRDSDLQSVLKTANGIRARMSNVRRLTLILTAEPPLYTIRRTEQEGQMCCVLLHEESTFAAEWASTIGPVMNSLELGFVAFKWWTECGHPERALASRRRW